MDPNDPRRAPKGALRKDGSDTASLLTKAGRMQARLEPEVHTT